MKLINPVTITGSMLVSASLPETDCPEWNPAENVAAGLRRMVSAEHTVYQRLVAGATIAEPADDPVNWVRVGPTNRWAMFDRATGTASSATGSIAVTLAPGLVDAVALLDVVATTVTVVMTVGAAEVYRRVVNLISGEGIVDAYTYFFNPVVMRRTVVLTDLPPYASGRISVLVEGSGTVSVGTCAVGRVVNLGATRYGVSLGLIDYSTKATDQFGTVTVTQRAYAKRMTVPFVAGRAIVDNVMRVLAELRATPVVWVGARQYDSSVIYGYARDAQTLINYETASECSVTIEGLV